MPAVDALLSRHAATNLGDYVARLERPGLAGFQDNHDFIDEIAGYTRDTLGSELGQAIGDDLRDKPQVLTANHHGIDTFAQSTQSNLLFSMRRGADGGYRKTIPVLACGSVPLNNLTFPRGLLLYAASAASANGGICRLPLFPDSYKRRLVSVTQPFTAEMLGRARARSERLAADSRLSRALESALKTVFDDFSGVVGKFDNYARQATVINHRFWQRLFRGSFCPSQLVYVELETIVCRLLQNDLFDQSSICHQLMFDPELRSRLVENLDGQRGCWQYQKLLQRCSDSIISKTGHATDSAQGTMLFWGVDDKGRKIPLCLVEGEGAGAVELRGIDDGGRPWTHPFGPAQIARGLRERRLLPSIFTSYLLVAIARGIGCIGGYYQADYLPAMRAAVMATLRGDAMDNTSEVSGAGPDSYLSGMQAVGLSTDTQLLPAGPLEIMASGGLDAEQYARIGKVTVLDAHIASLYDTVMDVAPPGGDCGRNRSEITRLVQAAVGDKIVSISTDSSLELLAN